MVRPVTQWALIGQGGGLAVQLPSPTLGPNSWFQRPLSRGKGGVLLDRFWFVKCLFFFFFFSWTNQIPSSTFSALSVQLWPTGPVWVAVQGAGTVSPKSLSSLQSLRDRRVRGLGEERNLVRGKGDGER